MTRVLNFLLIVVTIVGVAQLMRQRRILSVLEAEHKRLSTRYGALPVTDPSQYLVTRIDTGDSRHFLWRCYFPASPGYLQRTSFGRGSGSTSTQGGDAGDFLVRCRFELCDGNLNAHVFCGGRSGRTGIRDAPFVAFLDEHWNDLDIELLAAEGTVEVPTDQVLPFVTIRIPEALVPKLPKGFRARHEFGGKNHPVFQMVFGTNGAFATYDASQLQESR